MPYLLKTEPTAYSLSDLERENETVWDGVSNPVALRFLRSMKPGEKLVIYHTGDERTAVGTAKVVSLDAADPKAPVVRIKMGSHLKTPHTALQSKLAQHAHVTFFYRR